MKKNILIVAILFSGVSFAQKTDKKAKKEITRSEVKSITFTDDQKASYYLGLDIARNMKKQGLNLDTEMVKKGMNEEITGAGKSLPESEMQTFLQGYFQKLNEKKMEERKLQGEKNKKAGQDFFEKNKLNANIKTTASGLQYEVLKPGEGVAQPKETDVVKVIYEGKLLDGTVFDSTEKNGGEPLSIQLNGVIKGWTEGLQLMKKGAKYRFYIPSDLAYGDNGAGDVIPPGSALIFDVELLDFNGQTQESSQSINETTKK